MRRSSRKKIEDWKSGIATRDGSTNFTRTSMVEEWQWDRWDDGLINSFTRETNLDSSDEVKRTEVGVQVKQKVVFMTAVCVGRWVQAKTWFQTSRSAPCAELELRSLSRRKPPSLRHACNH